MGPGQSRRTCRLFLLLVRHMTPVATVAVAACIVLVIQVWTAHHLRSSSIALREVPLIVFCTSELEHLTSGGAGVVVADSARALFQAGWKVRIILDVIGETQQNPDDWVARAKQEWGHIATRTTRAFDKSPRPDQDGDINLVLLSTLASKSHHCDVSVAKTPPWQKSMQWAAAIRPFRHLATAIEFWDYGGPAYFSLVERANQSSSQIWIRTHGTHQDIEEDDHSLHTSVVFHIEARALQLADRVIANTDGVARKYVARYGLDPRRIAVIPPTLGTLEALHGNINNAASSMRAGLKNVLVYGKLQRVKGPDLAASALVLAMQRLTSSQWNGTAFFAGDDMPCDDNANVNMSTCILASTVPKDLRARFRFVGRLKRGSLGSFAAEHSIRFAVLPSRHETFCLAAHEAAYFGIPLVLPKLPAYEGYFTDNKGALMFESHSNSADYLSSAIHTALISDEWITNLPPPIIYRDPSRRYMELVD